MQPVRRFLVEEWGGNHVQWGSIDPATKKLQKVKVKDVDPVGTHNTKNTKENGFKNICFPQPGTSPPGYIDLLDDSGLERIKSDFVCYLEE